MAAPISPTARAFLDSQAEVQRIELQAALNEDGQSTVEFLLQETRHAYQIIDQRQDEVRALQVEIAQLRGVATSAPVEAQIPAVLTEIYGNEVKNLSNIVEKFTNLRLLIEDVMSGQAPVDQIDIDSLLEDIKNLETTHANYESGINSIITFLQDARTSSDKTIASLSRQVKAVNEQATAAEKAAGHAAVSTVQNMGATSIEIARLRAEVNRPKIGTRNGEFSHINESYANRTHGISDQDLKELLDFANKYTNTAPTLESNLRQLIRMLAGCQEGTSSDDQSCGGSNSASGSGCEIDFTEYIRLFDESIENANCLQDRIDTLESIVRNGRNVSPERFDSFIQLTGEINRLNRRLDEANSEIWRLKSDYEDGLADHQSAPVGDNVHVTHLLKRITELETANMKLGEELNDAANVISNMEAEKEYIDDEANDYNMNDSDDVGGLHEEIDSLRRQVAALRRGSQDDKFRKLTNELSNCQNEKVKATREAPLLEHSLQFLQGDFNAKVAEVAHLQEAIDRLRQNPASPIDAAEIARLTAALAECQNNRRKAAGEIAQLEELLDECTEQQEDSLPNPDASAEIARLNQALTKALSNVLTAKNENVAIQELLDAYKAEKSDPQSTKIDIAEIAVRANRVQGLEDKIREAETTISSLQARIAGDRTAGHQAEVDELNERLQELSDQMDKREIELADLQEEHAEQTAVFEVLGGQMKDLTAQRDRAESDLETELQENGDKVAGLNAKINDLQKRPDESNKARTKPAADRESAQLKKQVKDLTAEKDALQEQIDRIDQDPEQTAAVRHIRAERADLRKELQEAKRDLERRDNAVTKAEAEVNRLEIALYKADGTADRIRGERTKARMERDDARKLLQDCETSGGSHADVEALRAEVAKYKSQAFASDSAQGIIEIERAKLRRDRDKAIADRDEARRERDDCRGKSPQAIQNLMNRITGLERQQDESIQSQQEAEDDFAAEKSILRNRIAHLETTLTNTQKLLDASRQTIRDAEDESTRQLEQLKSQLLEERDNTKQLQDEFVATQADGNQPESQRNASLVRLLQQADVRFRAREQVIDDMDTRLNAAKASNNVEAAELRRQLAVAQAEITRLNIDPTPDQEELAHLREENDRLNGKLQDLKDAGIRLRNEQAEVERLRKAIRGLCLKVKEGRCCEKAREAAGLTGPGGSPGNSADEYHEAERESRLATIAALEDELKETRRVVANLSITLERNTRDSERQTSENLMNLATARAQITSLTAQLENLSPETDAHLWQKITDCKKEAEAKEKLTQELRDDLVNLQLKLENVQAEVFKLRDDISDLENTNADLENRLSKCLHSKKQSPRVPDTIKTEYEKDEEIQALKDQLAKKDAQLKSKRKQNRDPRAKPTDYDDDNELIEAMAENEQLRDLREKERKSLVGKARALREQLKEAESKIAELTKSNEELRNESRECIAPLSDKINGRGVKLGSIAESGTNDDAALKSLIATLKEHNKRLQRELDASKDNDTLQDRQRQIANLELEIEDLQYKLASVNGNDTPFEAGNQISTDERNSYIIRIGTWQQRIRELEEEIDELKQELAGLKAENARLADELKTKADFLDKVMNTVDNFKEEVTAIEEADTVEQYDIASDTSQGGASSVEIITEHPRTGRDALTPAEDAGQKRELQRRMTGSSIRRTITPAADDKLVTTRGKRAAERAATTEQEPAPKRGRRNAKTIPEESAEPEKRVTRSSKRKMATAETSAKQPKPADKKRKLR